MQISDRQLSERLAAIVTCFKDLQSSPSLRDEATAGDARTARRSAASRSRELRLWSRATNCAGSCSSSSTTGSVCDRKCDRWSKLWGARSRLYRSRFSRPNTRRKAFDEINHIDSPLHRSTPFFFQIFAKLFCKTCKYFQGNSQIVAFFEQDVHRDFRRFSWRFLGFS